jgi:hypothetical protein
MAEKYGLFAGRKLPDHEAEAHAAAREREDKTHPNLVGDLFCKRYPKDWNP